MRFSFCLASTIALLLALTGCPTTHPSSHTAGLDDSVTDSNAPTQLESSNPEPFPTPPESLTETPNPVTGPSPAPAPVVPAVSGNIPYGVPVPGKPNYVTSPHAPSQGYVDVRGFPPGTEVKCPYTGKVFLVP